MSGSRRKVGSDLAKVDAHVVGPREHDEIPELTADWFREADRYHGEKLVRRGRPPAANPKQAISIRLSPDVVAAFRQTGPGWQTRIDVALREWLDARATGRRPRAAAQPSRRPPAQRRKAD